MPGWKRGSVSVVRETRLGNSVAAMFRPTRARRRGRSARLFDKQSELHMGGDGKFCLVESMFHNGGKQYLRRDPTMVDLDVPYPRRRVLRVTTFGLQYNKAGNLQIMRRQGHASIMFKRPHDCTERSLEHVAFWV
jgi:hypothetical protein